VQILWTKVLDQLPTYRIAHHTLGCPLDAKVVRTSKIASIRLTKAKVTII